MEHYNPILGSETSGQKFITCGEIMRLEQQFLTRQLTGEEAASNWEVSHPEQYQQLSLFDAAVPGHI